MLNDSDLMYMCGVQPQVKKHHGGPWQRRHWLGAERPEALSVVLIDFGIAVSDLWEYTKSDLFIGCVRFTPTKPNEGKVHMHVPRSQSAHGLVCRHAYACM